jgi:hypothetical protein
MWQKYGGTIKSLTSRGHTVIIQSLYPQKPVSQLSHSQVIVKNGQVIVKN